MPPVDRVVCRFAAEPPQEALPYGRWADRLREEFLGACLRLDPEDGAVGEPHGDVVFYPDRTWDGRTYVPVTSSTTTGGELFGYVAYAVPEEGEEASDLFATAEFTDQTADANPDWRLDLCDDVIGGWRGEAGKRAAMTLVWGRPLVDGGAIATAELTALTVDQCTLVEDRFTLVAPDAYRGDTLDVRLWTAGGKELAAESLYEEDDDADEAPEPAA